MTKVRIFMFLSVISFGIFWAGKSVLGSSEETFDFCDREQLKKWYSQTNVSVIVEKGSLPENYIDLVPEFNGLDSCYAIEVINNVEDNIGIYEVVLFVTNANDDSLRMSIEVIVEEDITPPEILGASDLTVEINSRPNFFEGVTVSDNKSSNDEIIFDVFTEKLDLTKVGVYEITYYAEDKHGNFKTVDVNVTVIDTLKPSIINAEDLEFQVFNLPDEDYFIDQLQVEDNSFIEGDWKDYVTCNVDLSKVNSNKLGKYEFTYTCQDESGNEVSETRTITIVDTTKPVITFAENFEYLIGSGPINFQTLIHVQDNYDTLTFDDLLIHYNNVDFQTPGIYFVTVSVTDSSGNRTTVAKGLKVYDNDKPIFVDPPERLEFQVGSEISEINLLEGITVIDKTDGDLTDQIIVIENLVNYDKLGTYKVVYLVTDRSGNTTELELDIIIKDDNKPEIIEYQDIIEVDVFDEDYDFLKHIIVKDDYDPNPTVRIEHQIDFSTIGVYELTYIVEDSSGNQTTLTITVKIVDRESPVLEPVNDVTIKVGEALELLDYIFVKDNYDSYDDLNIEFLGYYDVEKEGKYIMKIVITDTSGNKSEQTFYIIVETDEQSVDQNEPGKNHSIQLLSFFGDEKITYVVSFTAGVIFIGLGVRWFQRKKYNKNRHT